MGRNSFRKARPKISIEELESLEISEDLFSHLIADKTAKEIFQDLEVADDDLDNLFTMLDVDASGLIELPELYDGISKLRGSAKRSDLICTNILLQRILQEMATSRGLECCAEASTHTDLGVL